MTAGQPGWPRRPGIGSSRHERPRFGRRLRGRCAQLGGAVGKEDRSPIRTSAAIRRYETFAEDASPAATLAPDTRSMNGRRDEIHGATLQVTQRIFGPARSVRMASGRWVAAAARRTASAAAACEAGVPCEKLIRATSIPAAASVSIRRSVAGPIVQIASSAPCFGVSRQTLVGLYRAPRSRVAPGPTLANLERALRQAQPVAVNRNAGASSGTVAVPRVTKSGAKCSTVGWANGIRVPGFGSRTTRRVATVSASVAHRSNSIDHCGATGRPVKYSWMKGSPWVMTRCDDENAFVPKRGQALTRGEQMFGVEVGSRPAERHVCLGYITESGTYARGPDAVRTLDHGLIVRMRAFTAAELGRSRRRVACPVVLLGNP